ncbi:hypothetical protein [Jannaschia pohangensis]|uniref:Uncharacterized protein n=1 Tax=Jannaschia pohangensis TaxID=390807 RepID=A0A1I3LW16_9RHOB|nr:hypothetical protein [Jannaschia pohangensis]SFI88929.1 hypothetical protein SAMN04488095_1651 [Jannaschia pohangensis]
MTSVNSRAFCALIALAIAMTPTLGRADSTLAFDPPEEVAVNVRTVAAGDDPENRAIGMIVPIRGGGG